MSKNSPNVNVSITFRHTDSTEALKAYAAEKIEQCVKKYVNYDAEAKVVLSIEKRDQIAEVNVHSKGFDATARAVTVDLYAAIDKVVDSLHAQLRKQKERLVNRSSRLQAEP
jgi:putative sigma-54 modulation protein